MTANIPQSAPQPSTWVADPSHYIPASIPQSAPLPSTWVADSSRYISNRAANIPQRAPRRPAWVVESRRVDEEVTQDWNRVVDAVKTRPPNEVARDITVLHADSLACAQWQDIEKALAVCTQTRVLALLNDVRRAEKIMTAVRALPLTHFAVIDLADTEIKYLPPTLTHLSIWWYISPASDFPSSIFPDLHLPAILKQCPNLTHLFVRADGHHERLDDNFTKTVMDAMATLPPEFEVFIIELHGGELWGDAEVTVRNLAAIAAKDKRCVFIASYMPPRKDGDQDIDDVSKDKAVSNGEDSNREIESAKSSGMEDTEDDTKLLYLYAPPAVEVEGLLSHKLVRDFRLDWGAGWNDDASLWKVAKRFVESRNH